jgi:hypothetical protein
MEAVLMLAIVMPMDSTPFKVTEKEVVRLVESGIAGSRIEAKVEGPAKVSMTATIRQLRNGRPMIGNTTHEFDIKPTGKGRVKVIVTVTPPQPDAKPKVVTYEFEVE